MRRVDLRSSSRSTTTKSASRPGSSAPLRSRPKMRAGFVLVTATTRDSGIRPAVDTLGEQHRQDRRDARKPQLRVPDRALLPLAPRGDVVGARSRPRPPVASAAQSASRSTGLSDRRDDLGEVARRRIDRLRQVVRLRLGEDRLPAAPRGGDDVDRLPRGDVDDVQRAARARGEEGDASDGLELDDRRPAGREAGQSVAAGGLHVSPPPGRRAPGSRSGRAPFRRTGRRRPAPRAAARRRAPWIPSGAPSSPL